MLNLAKLRDNVAKLASDDSLIQDFFGSKLLEAIASKLNLEPENLSDREKLSLELVTQIVKLQELLNVEYDKEVELNFELHATLKSTLRMQKVMEQGSSFNSFMTKIKFKAIM